MQGNAARGLEIRELASVVAFLVGPDGGRINGQVLRANGGMV